jgi:hypothetical protein
MHGRLPVVRMDFVRLRNRTKKAGESSFLMQSMVAAKRNYIWETIVRWIRASAPTVTRRHLAKNHRLRKEVGPTTTRTAPLETHEVPARVQTAGRSPVSVPFRRDAQSRRLAKSAFTPTMRHLGPVTTTDWLYQQLRFTCLPAQSKLRSDAITGTLTPRLSQNVYS